ncbi:ubiquinone/menaquinone biosynthesis C-methylase UbiE [Rhizobium sp. SG_E_25_P2]|jgi:ubiquinone/menaquinone biosynthesis C-methylase UbiE|uniref:ArsR/SmtB family transcription factor n=1 Tax=Rhizobium sp. SG_E_25_P2 TaxID=2879942 RepID=UPI002475876A|nr:metalloregulator ArsR/SmtB family transcription factor [Rhizobium sp. SG_E_25_P2]MDH6269220.1 ubiquinone/menaquinone biosynthesis C-methylase UbiE [Rhizobium sp. SG_E_25_P2]
MANNSGFSLNSLVEILKASAEPTRLRLLVLLSSGDLTVSDLTEILGQSQPRISRHLKLLAEAGLIERYQEGAWAWFRLRRDGESATLTRKIIESASGADAVITRDQARLAQVRVGRAQKASEYFSQNAEGWDQLRKLHVAEEKVEAALRAMVGTRPVNAFLDLGTGTGRLLQLFEGIYRTATGVDASREMLSVARANLEKAGLAKATIRLGDIFNLPLESESYDLVSIHQVLHFLENPELALAEAARMLRPGGRLVVVDFAPHGLDSLRSEHHHARLGFSHQQMSDWLEEIGLDLVEVKDLTPQTAGEALTVTLWLARDRRIEIAAESAPALTATSRRS